MSYKEELKVRIMRETNKINVETMKLICKQWKTPFSNLLITITESRMVMNIYLAFSNGCTQLWAQSCDIFNH